MTGLEAVLDLPLTGDLTIQTATETRTILLAALESADGLEIDLSAVTELDTAGLQLLLLAKREAVQLGKTLRFATPSRSVLDVLALAHLTPDLDDVGAGQTEVVR